MAADLTEQPKSAEIALQDIDAITEKYAPLVEPKDTPAITKDVLEKTVDERFREFFGELAKKRESFLKLIHAYEANGVGTEMFFWNGIWEEAAEEQKDIRSRVVRYEDPYFTIPEDTEKYRKSFQFYEMISRGHPNDKNFIKGILMKTESLIKDKREAYIPSEKEIKTVDYRLDLAWGFMTRVAANSWRKFDKNYQIVRDHKKNSRNFPDQPDKIYQLRLGEINMVIPELTVRECGGTIFFCKDGNQPRRVNELYSHRSIDDFAAQYTTEEKMRILAKSKYFVWAFERSYVYLLSEKAKKQENLAGRLDSVSGLKYDDFSKI